MADAWKNVPADKPPAKLALAVKKNVRDGYESKKPEFEAKLEKHLGTKWHLDIHPDAIYPYAKEGSYGHNSLGNCISEYVNGFIFQLDYWIGKNGKGLVDELNKVVSKHALTLVASNKVQRTGIDIEDGSLRLLFHPNELGVNISQCGEGLPKALSAASESASGGAGLSYAARNAIANDFEAKVGVPLEKARKTLKNPDFKFEPDFDQIAGALKNGKGVRSDWETSLGRMALEYYTSLATALDWQNFGKDDMLQEGFQEAVENNVAKLRIVEKTTNGKRNESVIEDGAFVMQTTPENWAVNISQTTEDIVKLL